MCKEKPRELALSLPAPLNFALEKALRRHGRWRGGATSTHFGHHHCQGSRNRRNSSNSHWINPLRRQDFLTNLPTENHSRTNLREATSVARLSEHVGQIGKQVDLHGRKPLASVLRWIPQRLEMSSPHEKRQVIIWPAENGRCFVHSHARRPCDTNLFVSRHTNAPRQRHGLDSIIRSHWPYR